MAGPADERRELPGPRGSAGFEANRFTQPAKTAQRNSVAVRNRCPNCGAVNRGHTSICTECGENLQTRPRKIRCRHCGQRASSLLVICPHCGRELVESPVQVWFVVAPVALALLFFVVLAARWSQLQPLGWLQTQVDAGLSLINSLGESMDPTIIIETTPVSSPDEGETGTATENEAEVATPTPETQPEAAVPPDEPVVETQPASLALVSTQSDTSLALASPTVAEVPTLTPTDTPPPSPTDTATPAPTGTATPTETATETTSPTNTVVAATVLSATASVTSTAAALVVLPSATPTRGLSLTAVRTAQQTAGVITPTVPSTVAILADPTATATPAPTDTPSPTPAPQETYQVRPGDTLSAIAGRFAVSVNDLMRANNLTAQDAYALHPGDVLIIPRQAAVQPAAAASSPTPAPSPRTYRVQAGDTPIGIANAFGVTVDALLQANGLTLADARNLRTGQELVIPNGAQANSIADNANGTAALRLDSPRLRSPENGAQVSCSAGSTLAWENVPFILSDDQFVLHLGFVSSIAADGQETVVWVLEQVQSSQNTLWMMDPSLCALAPQELGRKWYWYVEVVDANRVSVSEPSPVWSFFWN